MYCPPHDPLFLERVYCNPPNNDSVHHILVLRNQPLVCVQYSRVECFFSHFISFVLSKEYWRTNLLGIFFLAFSYANAIKISKKKEKDVNHLAYVGDFLTSGANSVYLFI